MDSIVSFINDVGATLKGSIATLITLNYVVGEAAISLALWICQSFLRLCLAVSQVIHILLEDFGTFLEELSETVGVTCLGLYNSVDRLLSLGFKASHVTYLTASHLASSLYAILCCGLRFIYQVSDLVGKSISLTACSFIVGLRLIPSTVYHGCCTLYRGIGHLLLASYDVFLQSLVAIKEAPYETILGFVTATLFMYLSYRTAQRIIVERQITAQHLARWTVQAICFLYVLFVNIVVRGTVSGVSGVARTLEFTLR